MTLMNGELVSPLGVAYSISEDGIPNLVPADARMITEPE